MIEELNINNDSVKRAIVDITAIRQEIAMMGANDFEIPAINGLIERLKRGDYSPEKAIKEATEIRDRKQDYH